ncbi:MAG: tRNA nucleotidyltransferase, partial [Candidatus Dormiibacterota bacterium]
MSSGEVVRQLDVSNDPLFDLLRRAAGSGGETWVVGGYVRDRLLGRDAHPDVDVVVVDASARDLAERVAVLAGAPPPAVFERFGTAQVTWDERRLEFVAARRESYRPESRKPDVEPATLDEDLQRRDFTVNALVCDLSGAVHDPLGGLPDLERRVLRTPLDPRATFRDDPLRMLRAARFAAQLGFRL